MGENKKVAIVGAGISGLATAFYLQQNKRASGLDLEISVIEKSSQPGGVIRTEQANDLLLEWGPENFVAFRPLILELIDAVGLSGDLIGSNDDRRRTYVVHDGALQPLPEGMAFLAPVDLRSFWSTRLISTSGKLRACLEPFISKSKGDLSVQDFLKRRLGRELTERIAEPLVSAIYGGDASRLSLASALPETHHLEQKYGSLWKGMRAGRKRKPSGSQPFFRSLRRGMSGLVGSLVDHLTDATFLWQVPDLEVSRNSSGFRLRSNGWEECFDAVAVCTPAIAAAKIIDGVSDSCAAWLKEIPYTSSWLVYLAYNRDEFSHPLDGFGFVAPEREADVLDACTWVSTKFDGRCADDTVLLRCALHNGRRDRQPQPEEEMIEKVQQELVRLLGINCRPKFARAEPAAGEMAQPNVNHGRRLRKIQSELARHPGLFLTGAYTSGVGVPSCVAGGKATAHEIVELLFPGN